MANSINDVFGVGSPRRRMRWGDIIRAEVPSQRRRFYDAQQRKLEEEAIAEAERRHREQMAFAREQRREAEKQGDIQTASGLGTMAVAGGRIGQIGAAIGAQHMATEHNPRTYEGQQTGDVFTTEEGNWRPRFFTEPWKGYASSQAGHEDATSGEKFDAALANAWSGDINTGKLVSRVPGVAYQWLDPFGSSVHDYQKDWLRDQSGLDLSDQEADVVGALLGNPSAIGDFFEDLF